MYRWSWVVEDSDSISPLESCCASAGQHPTPYLPSQLLPSQKLSVRKRRPSHPAYKRPERKIDIAATISLTYKFTRVSTVVPLLYGRFVSCIQLFLQYDSVCPQGVTQQVTHRVAPLLTGTTYGDNVRLLNSVIQVRHNQAFIIKMYFRSSAITECC